uniref:Secreted protein n=1 Tax=Anguilla anguilla TaxID=7936 RepID=A0A0E9QUR7_ANGAN
MSLCSLCVSVCKYLLALMVYCQNHGAPPTSHQHCGAPPPHISTVERTRTLIGAPGSQIPPGVNSQWSSPNQSK